MKSNYKFLSLLLAIFSAVSCSTNTTSSTFNSSNNTNSNISSVIPTPPDSSSTPTDRDTLEISASFLKNSFSQYDTFSKGDMKVISSKDGNEIEDFKITYKNTEKELKDGDVLLKSGNFKMVVSSGNLQGEFTLKIFASSSFEESLSVIQKEDEIFVDDNVADSFDVLDNYSYIDGKGNRKESSFVPNSIQYKYENNDLPTFNSSGVILLNIKATGLKGNTISTSKYINVLNKELNKLGGNSTESLTADTSTLNININNSRTLPSTYTKNFYSSDEVEVAYTAKQYGLNSYWNYHYMPSKGQIPLLVIPLVMPGYMNSVTSEMRDKIEKAFFGSKSDGINYESVRSYYYKSSFGQLDLYGEVTDYFDVEKNTGYTNTNKITTDQMDGIRQSAFDWALNTYNIDSKDLDSDKDGAVDGVWFIYIGPNSSPSSSMTTATPFWAYTSYIANPKADVDNPVMSVSSFAGYDFITQDVAITSGFNYDDNKGLDSHVLIHETGHMLGLNDYYNTYGDSTYSPLGGLDMMDGDFGDNNPYSKILLGWVTPSIYTGYGSLNQELNSCNSKNSMIILPLDNKVYSIKKGKIQFNPYDEYLIVDYYSSTNLYEQDYTGKGMKTLKGNGGRILHVDNRLSKRVVEDNKVVGYLLDNPDDILTDSTLKLSNTITNSYKQNDTDKYGAFDEIRFISADGKKVSKNTNYVSNLSSSSLFQKNQTFNLSSYKSQFVNESVDTSNASFTTVVKFN